MKYVIQNWYWLVGASSTEVWSSAEARFVPVDDPNYKNFLSATNFPSSIDSLDSLTALFAEQFPAGMLLTYVNARQWQKATGGYPTTVGGIAITIPTSSESLGLIGGKVQRLQMPNSPATVNWQTGPTSFVDIAAADFISIAIEIADFVQSTFDTLKVALTDIQSGAITTTQQIDQRFA